MRSAAKLKLLCNILILMVMLAGCSTGKSPIQVSEMMEATITQATAVPTEPEETTLPTTVPIETTGMTEPRAEPIETQPLATEPPTTTPPTTASTETTPPETVPPTIEPPTTAPSVTQPPATVPTEPPAAETIPTTPAPTDPEETTPPATEEPTVQSTKPTEEFKQEVAYYAAYYINQYRTASGAPICTILPGMTQVAEYRADQLTFNYSHDTDDKREALAYYQYGRWVDATIVGLDPSQSYYEADTTEAICAGFEGKTAEEMGKYIADLCRNSSSHWSYIGSSKNLYIGIGVEYRPGSTYGWYGCIMVGRTNYG